MKPGIGSQKGGKNKVYVTLKMKNNSRIDPFMSVKRYVDDELKDADPVKEICGRFAGIGHDTYTLPSDNEEKHKVMIYLANEDDNELYVVQVAMNGFARNLMNNMLNLLTNHSGDIDMLKIGVWQSSADDGTLRGNISLRHENAAIGHTEDQTVRWLYDWEQQKTKIKFAKDTGEKFNNYDELEKFLIDRWLKAGSFIEEKHPKYKELKEKILNSAASAPSSDAPPAPKDSQIPPQGEGGDLSEEDDLPF